MNTSRPSEHFRSEANGRGAKTLGLEVYWASGRRFTWRMLLTLEGAEVRFKIALLRLVRGPVWLSGAASD
jgi:hypothetical protein